MSLPIPELKAPTHPLAMLPEEWEAQLLAWGEQKYRAQQVFHWIHKQGVLDPDEMTNLSKALREKLHQAGLQAPLGIEKIAPSNDGTRKLLVGMTDGARVETVLIPELSSENTKRFETEHEDAPAKGCVVTQCISSQVGCAMGCTFCASGIAGLTRHMNAAEIVAQVIQGKQVLEEGEYIRNIVLMGMGEPLHNYDEVARALVLLTHPEGLALSKRRITVSTSGLIPQIDRLGKDFQGQVQLAVSLHATDDQTRSEIMPVNKKYPIKDLLACLKRYPLPKRRRITIEYTLINQVNDSYAHADKLVKLLKGIPTKVNLIPMNPITSSAWQAPSTKRVMAFRERIAEQGLSAFVRKTRGDDVAAACGQLAFQGKPKTKRHLVTQA